MNSARTESTREDPQRRWVVLVVLAIMTMVLFWRRPDMVSNPQFWAEDGRVFYQDVITHGLGSLALPYSGYFHIAARTSAWMGGLLPAEYVPHGYALLSWLLLTFLVVYIFSGRFRLRTDERVVLSLALVGTTASNEVFFNLANWATLAAPSLMLLSVAGEPRTTGERWFDFVLLVVVGLSTPFTVCLWVLFGVRLLLRRTTHDAALFMVSIAVAALQLRHMSGRLAEPQAGPLIERAYVLGLHEAFVFFGEATYRLPFSTLALWCVLAGFVLLYGITAWRAWASNAEAALLFLISHVLVVAVSFYVMRTWDLAPLIGHTGRHQYLAGVTAIWAFFCLRMIPAQWIPVGLAFAAFVFLNPSNKREIRSDLHWSKSVASCRSHSGPCRIDIHPITPPPQVWTVTLQSN